MIMVNFVESAQNMLLFMVMLNSQKPKDRNRWVSTNQRLGRQKQLRKPSSTTTWPMLNTLMHESSARYEPFSWDENNEDSTTQKHGWGTMGRSMSAYEVRYPQRLQLLDI